MKKILTTLAVSGIALGAFAQGYVNWGSTPGGNVIGATNSLNYSSLSVALGAGLPTAQQGAAQGVTASLNGNAYYYELLYSTVDTTTPTTLTALANNWTATGLHMQANPAANNGRLVPINPNGAAAIDPGYTSGSLSLMLVGWSTNLGTTFGGVGGVLSELQNWNAGFAGLANSYFGLSFVGQTALSTSSVAGTSIFAASQSPGGLISNPSAAPLVMNELLAVPEPGTLALAAIGGASLLLFRRKK